ncbi:DUF4142 domain-containing protein, partial [Mesorhizobium sp. B3-1-1]
MPPPTWLPASQPLYLARHVSRRIHSVSHTAPLSAASLRRCHCRQKLALVEFDLAYISGQIVDHQKTVQLLEWEIGSGRDPDVQHFASDILPAVLEHLRMARDIRSKLVNPALADASGQS